MFAFVLDEAVVSWFVFDAVSWVVAVFDVVECLVCFWVFFVEVGFYFYAVVSFVHFFDGCWWYGHSCWWEFWVFLFDPVVSEAACSGAALSVGCGYAFVDEACYLVLDVFAEYVSVNAEVSVACSVWVCAADEACAVEFSILLFQLEAEIDGFGFCHLLGG